MIIYRPTMQRILTGFLAAIMGLGAATVAQAQTAIDCEEAYHLIFGALNGSRTDGKPATARNDVPDGAVSWALDFEKKARSGDTSCTPPGGVLGAYLGVVQAENRMTASVAAAPVTKALKQMQSSAETDEFGFTASDYFTLGEASLLIGSMESAHQEFTTACNMGHTMACYEASGQGDANNEFRTIAFWADGCRRGDSRACTKLDGVKETMSDVRMLIPFRLSAGGYAADRKNYAEAKRIFSGLCEEGYGRGCYEEAQILENIERNTDKAAIAKLYNRACALDIEDACR